MSARRRTPQARHPHSDATGSIETYALSVRETVHAHNEQAGQLEVVRTVQDSLWRHYGQPALEAYERIWLETTLHVGKKAMTSLYVSQNMRAEMTWDFQTQQESHATLFQYDTSIKATQFDPVDPTELKVVGRLAFPGEPTCEDDRDLPSRLPQHVRGVKMWGFGVHSERARALLKLRVGEDFLNTADLLTAKTIVTPVGHDSQGSHQLFEAEVPKSWIDLDTRGFTGLSHERAVHVQTPTMRDKTDDILDQPSLRTIGHAIKFAWAHARGIDEMILIEEELKATMDHKEAQVKRMFDNLASINEILGTSN